MQSHSTLTAEWSQPTLTWSELVGIEPRLAALESMTRAVPRRYRSWQRWESIKRTLRKLAGWEAEQPLLRTSAAYNAVYSRLFAIWEGVA